MSSCKEKTRCVLQSSGLRYRLHMHTWRKPPFGPPSFASPFRGRSDFEKTLLAPAFFRACSDLRSGPACAWRSWSSFHSNFRRLVGRRLWNIYARKSKLRFRLPHTWIHGCHIFNLKGPDRHRPGPKTGGAQMVSWNI